jgi:multidrug efflux pump subunit AcrA (membrane-fusion protein)
LSSFASRAGVFFIRHLGAAPKPTAEKQLYTCGMHPQIIQDHPGNCPICEMKLQPVRKQAAQPSPGEGKADADSATITIDPATIQTMGVRLGEVTGGPLMRSVRTVGVVDFNETALTDVTAKFKGWIEKLFVDATGQAVKKGEPLFETYSPDVYNAELEFASLTRSGNAALAKTTLERLSLLGVAASELEKLKTAAQPSRTVTMFSPADGVVVEKTAVEGMMFEPGMNLYRLADLSLVWLKAQIYEQDMAFVGLGQEAVASIDSLPGRKFLGRVTYVYPTLDPKTRTAHGAARLPCDLLYSPYSAGRNFSPSAMASWSAMKSSSFSGSSPTVSAMLSSQPFSRSRTWRHPASAPSRMTAIASSAAAHPAR